MGSKTQNKSRKCLYFDRGYCKYGDSCQNQHPDKDCSVPICFDENCAMRHPNPCKFGLRCKFKQKNVCLYSHVTLANDEDNGKIKELERKIINLEKENKTMRKDNYQKEGVNFVIWK